MRIKMSKFIKDMDLSTLLELERCGAKYYEDGEPYGAGNNDLAETIAIGKKVTDAGFEVLLNFHYSE